MTCPSQETSTEGCIVGARDTCCCPWKPLGKTSRVIANGALDQEVCNQRCICHAIDKQVTFAGHVSKTLRRKPSSQNFSSPRSPPRPSRALARHPQRRRSRPRRSSRNLATSAALRPPEDPLKHLQASDSDGRIVQTGDSPLHVYAPRPSEGQSRPCQLSHTRLSARPPDNLQAPTYSIGRHDRFSSRHTGCLPHQTFLLSAPSSPFSRSSFPSTVTSHYDKILEGVRE